MKGLQWLNALSPKNQVGLLRGFRLAPNTRWSSGRMGPDLNIPSDLLLHGFDTMYDFINDSIVWHQTEEDSDYWGLIASDESYENYRCPWLGGISKNAGVMALAHLDIEDQFGFLKNLTNIGRRPIAPYLMSEFDCFESFIDEAFVWDITPEGREHWNGLAHKYEFSSVNK